LSCSPEILFSDDTIVVVNKPTMLLSVPGRGADKLDSVVTRLASHFPGIREVHRLDWETSGLMMLARTPEAHSEMSRQFREREIRKGYLAMVDGELEEEHGEISLPLRCDWPNRPRQMVDPEQGKPSLTRWRRLSVENGCSRVALTPVTGRSHQLRVHLMAIGHSILGDRLYANDKALALAERLLLHATHLAFHHPNTGEWLSLESPPPF